MIKTINFSDFCDAFRSYDRQDQFSYEAKRALFEHLESVEEEDAPIELDVIQLCCEYNEFASAYEAMEQYQPDDMPVEGVEGDDLIEIQAKNEAEALKWLEDRTQVIPFGNSTGVVILQF